MSLPRCCEGFNGGNIMMKCLESWMNWWDFSLLGRQDETFWSLGGEAGTCDSLLVP